MSDIGLPKGMSKDDSYIQGIADTERRIGLIVDDIIDSFKLAMQNYVSEEVLTSIVNEVNDYIDNHYDEDWNGPSSNNPSTMYTTSDPNASWSLPK